MSNEMEMGRDPASAERLPSEDKSAYCERITGITRAGQQSMREAIERAEGMLLSFIHPFFESYTEEAKVASHGLDSRTVEARIHRALHNKSTDHLPILIWEEGRNIARTKDRLREVPSSKVVQYIETLPQSGTPAFAHDMGSARAWKVMSEFLQHLGVRTLYVGGQYRKEGGGCVTIVVAALRSYGISVVEMPGLEFPGVGRRVQS